MVSTPPPMACPRCDQPVDVKSRHVVVSGSAVKVYCSDACLQGIAVIETPDEAQETPRRRRWWIATGFVVGSTFVALTYLTQFDDGTTPDTPGSIAFVPPPPVIVKPVHKPPPDEAKQADDELLRELSHDAWIHPLAGPQRRMPTATIHAFGAARAIDPPPECMSGHCGVDIGVGEPGIWGEPVLAVHDGVVAWVDRGPNVEYGGLYVKISHRDGTLFSWYFHLAAIPRWIHPGVHVKVGQVIGLLGDTGLRDPVAHLHFGMSVRPPKSTRERYIDPEPLIAIWPLWLPAEHGGARLSIATPPGLPVRARDHARPKPPPAPAPVEDPAAPQPETPTN